jgi:hypothetical protein
MVQQRAQGQESQSMSSIPCPIQLLQHGAGVIVVVVVAFVVAVVVAVVVVVVVVGVLDFVVGVSAFVVGCWIFAIDVWCEPAGSFNEASTVFS